MASWPKVDDSALEQDSLQMVIQVNGKLRSKIMVPVAADKQAIEKMALADETIQRYVEGKTIRKVIVVPKKLVNIVV